MELSLISRWIIFSSIWAMIAVMIAFSLVYIFTRLCLKRRRVVDTTIVTVSDDPFSSGPRGVDPVVIEAFKKFTYTAMHGKKQCHGMLVCVICLAVFKEKESLRSMPKCGHVFHSDCVDSWLKTHATCPCCRANLAPETGGSGLRSVLPAGLARLV